jgi:uncharacterized RDD family membrane protein YckC
MAEGVQNRETDSGAGVFRTRDELDPVSFATTAYDADRPPVPPKASLVDSLIGLTIDHFEIRALLGEGGMGTVYLAHDVSLNRPVAIKVLRRELSSEPDLTERLVLEAQAQARLQHPNVVNVYYIGSFNGSPYFAMEYVRGETLAERLSRLGPLSWEETLEFMIQTTRALLEAHERGIVHRDLKPSNLLIREAGRGAGALGHLKVADFGLAAETGRRQELMVGSPSYASPEQLAGKPPDHRSDIYSLGVTFHELITGALPFEAESLDELMRLHERAPRPPIPSRRAPWRLRQLITEMMDPAPTQRPWTYEELLDRLQTLRPRDIIAGGIAARTMALLTDASLFGVTTSLLVEAGVGVATAGAIGLALWGLHYIIGHRYWGQTLGKRLFRLRIQGSTRAISVPGLSLRFFVTLWGPILAAVFTLARGGWDLPAPLREALAGLWQGSPGSAEAFVLEAAPQLLILVLWAVGFAVAAIDEKTRALHDFIGRTRVIYAMRPDAADTRRPA